MIHFVTAPAPTDVNAAEDWATPATQQEIARQLSMIDSRTPSTRATTRNWHRHNYSPTTPRNPFETAQEAFTLHEADAWLANIDWAPIAAAACTNTSGGRDIPTYLHGDRHLHSLRADLQRHARAPSTMTSTTPGRHGTPASASPDVLRICTYCGKDCGTAANFRRYLTKIIIIIIIL